jgi:hypothetical protein
MRSYRLVYEDDRHGAAKWIEFEARDAGGALSIAKGEARGRWAQLFENGRYLCRLENADPDGANIWLVARSAVPEEWPAIATAAAASPSLIP